ncbi:MAG: hypothetical protein ACE5I1_01030 [bacterium]
MEAMRVQQMIERDGEIRLTGLPYKKGQFVEIIILNQSDGKSKRPLLTAKNLLRSDLVGLWKDRDEIKDRSAFARELRHKSQSRRG